MKLIVGALLLISLAVGGATGFIPVFLTLMKLLAALAALAFIGVLVWLVLRVRQKQAKPDPFASLGTSMPARAATWSTAAIAQGLEQLDWYQFEK